MLPDSYQADLLAHSLIRLGNEGGVENKRSRRRKRRKERKKEGRKKERKENLKYLFWDGKHNGTTPRGAIYFPDRFYTLNKHSSATDWVHTASDTRGMEGRGS